jgi:hypothetical protein
MASKGVKIWNPKCGNFVYIIKTQNLFKETAQI